MSGFSSEFMADLQRTLNNLPEIFRQWKDIPIDLQDEYIEQANWMSSKLVRLMQLTKDEAVLKDLKEAYAELSFFYEQISASLPEPEGVFLPKPEVLPKPGRLASIDREEKHFKYCFKHLGLNHKEWYEQIWGCPKADPSESLLHPNTAKKRGDDKCE